MPYATNADLPQAVRAHLPPHAQDIYREAFNHAYARYADLDESRIHRIAWAAVKRAYEKVAGEWVRRNDPLQYVRSFSRGGAR
jgi:cation transport regulator